MCEYHQKKTFREFRLNDAKEDFRCKECGWTVEIRGWMKGVMFFGGVIVGSSAMVLFDQINQVYKIESPWDLLFLIPLSIAISYSFTRIVGYFMYILAWKLDEKYR
jgi:prolipoprotein diacylglyceryltransferase